LAFLIGPTLFPLNELLFSCVGMSSVLCCRLLVEKRGERNHPHNLTSHKQNAHSSFVLRINGQQLAMQQYHPVQKSQKVTKSIPTP